MREGWCGCWGAYRCLVRHTIEGGSALCSCQPWGRQAGEPQQALALAAGRAVIHHGQALSQQALQQAPQHNQCPACKFGSFESAATCLVSVVVVAVLVSMP